MTTDQLILFRTSLCSHQAGFISSEQQFEFWRRCFSRCGHVPRISDRLLNNIKYLSHKRSTIILSEHVWKLKDASIGYTIEWTILNKIKPCSPALKKCDLRVAEKYFHTIRHILIVKQTIRDNLNMPASKKKHILQNCCSEETKPA